MRGFLEMRSAVTILLMLGLLVVPSAAVFAQTSIEPEIRSVQARLVKIDRARAEAGTIQGQLDSESARLRAELSKAKSGPDSALNRSEQQRLARRLLTIEKRRRALSSKQSKLDQRARAEASALLALYDSSASRGRLDASGQQARDALRQRLGLAPVGDRSPSALMRKAEQASEAESTLRRKARVVATRIRELRKESRLAGDVMRTVRDQALFDEEERRITVSRVRTTVVNNAADEQEQPEDQRSASIGGGGAESNAPPADPSADSDSSQEADDYSNSFGGEGGTTGAVPGSAGNTSGDGWDSHSSAAGSGGQIAGGVSVITSVVSGTRLSTLLGEDVGTLVGERDAVDGLLSPEEELRRLQALRVELLRSADEVGKRKDQLEIEARSPRR